MKKLLLFTVFTLFIFSTLSAQQSLNMTLLSNWDDNSLPSGWTGQYNDVWGYADGQGNEYAIIGAMLGSYIIDVTTPTNPVVVDYVPSKDQFTLAVHRDYKTYSHYCYAVADEGQNSLQIFDMQYLPDSVHVVYDSDQFSKRCHNLFISGDKLFLASNTVANNFNAMDVLSLANPESPTFLSSLFNPNFSHVHDVYVKNDTAYCSNGNAGLFIYNYANPVSPVLISSITAYPQQGYNHSSWLTDDSKYMVFADEDHGKALKVYDISDVQNPVLKGLFQSNLLNVPNPSSQDGSIPHNPFIVGDKAIVSYYHDGVQIYDISNPTNPTQVAYYDTYPQALNYSGYQGCWGVYPYLPSGIVLASDISNGLFVLDASTVLGIADAVPNAVSVTAYPNPFAQQLNVAVSGPVSGNIKAELVDMVGKQVYINNNVPAGNTFSIPAGGLNQGVYFIRITAGEKVYTKRVVHY